MTAAPELTETTAPTDLEQRCEDCGHDGTAIKRVLAKPQCATYHRDVDGIGDVVECYCRNAHHDRVVKRFEDRPEVAA